MRQSWWWVVVALALAVVARPVAAQFPMGEDPEPADTETTSETTELEKKAAESVTSKTTRDEMRRSLAATQGLQLPGSVDPDAYRVGPGDVMQVTLWGGVAKTWTIEVGPEGTVLLPSTGTLKVDGSTLRQARLDIMSRLRPEFRGVNIDVRLMRPRKFQVYVTGNVESAGPFEANGASRVADLILRAAPLKNGSLRQIDVLHRDGTRDKADLELFLRTGSQELNPWLRDGDVMHVPVAIGFVYAEGAVSRPARYELGPRDSLRTLLTMSGGLLPAADSTRALFLRWVDGAHSESVWVDLPALIQGRFNPTLRNGDRLYTYFVPQYQLQNNVTVLGQVGRPGIYPIRVGRDRLSHVIAAAGGFLPGADLSAVRVRRRNLNAGEEDPELERLLRLSRNELTNSEYAVLNTKLAGQREEYRIDWNRLTEKEGLDVLLVGGDVVQVERQVNSIRVDGQVRRPGIVSYQPGGKVHDYVRAAGGFSERAWHSKVRVTRSGTGQTFLAGDIASVEPGDFVWVPEKPDVTFWDQVKTVLAAAAEVATVVLAFNAVND